MHYRWKNIVSLISDVDYIGIYLCKTELRNQIIHVRVPLHNFDTFTYKFAGMTVPQAGRYHVLKLGLCDDLSRGKSWNKPIAPCYRVHEDAMAQ